MTKSQTLQLVGRINAVWSTAPPVPPDALAIWHEDLEDLHPEAVKAAFLFYRRSGAKFKPSAGELRVLALGMLEPGLTFDQVWAKIQHSVSYYGRHQADPALAGLTGVPLAVELVRVLGGWTALCNAGPDEQRPVPPQQWRAAAHAAYSELLAQRAADRGAMALTPALPRAAAARERLSLTPIRDLLPPITAAIERQENPA